jgi:limonene-1,2-epoxide hydrolase
MDKKEDEPKIYFGYGDIQACPKHVEAKILGNKYYNRLDNILERIVECALNITEENCAVSVKRLDGLQMKFDKMNIEFMGILRSTSKCCYPLAYARDYMDIYEIFV